jgi:tetratricopeptide (TPR) repeat protein
VTGALLALQAWLQITLGRHDRALATAQEAIALGQTSGPTGAARPEAPGSEGSRLEGVALGHLVRGQALRRQGQSLEAVASLQEALWCVQGHREFVAGATTGAAGAAGAGAAAVSATPELLHDVEVVARLWLGSIALLPDHDYARARNEIAQALRVCRALGKARGEMGCLDNLATIALEAGDYAAAERDFERALTLARAVGDRWGEGEVQRGLSMAAQARGEYARAHELAERALTILREFGSATAEAAALANLGHLCTLLGDYARAAACFARFRRVVRAPGAPASESLNGLLAQVLLAHRTGDDRQALADAEESWQLAQRLDDPQRQAWALLLMGHAQAAVGRTDEPATAYRESVRRYLALGRGPLAAAPRAGLARLALAHGARAAALAEVEALLPDLAGDPPAGLHEPFDVYLTVYRALAASDDPRAAGVLRTGQRLLRARAEGIADAALRRSFLHHVASHRELLCAASEHDPAATPRAPPPAALLP